MISQRILINPLPLVNLGDDYRALPRVSNSDLTRLKEEHLGYVPAIQWQSLRRGRMLRKQKFLGGRFTNTCSNLKRWVR